MILFANLSNTKMSILSTSYIMGKLEQLQLRCRLHKPDVKFQVHVLEM